MVVNRKGIAMSDRHRTVLGLFALIACSVLPGCNQRLLQERDALFAENQGLSEQLTSARAELAAEQGRTASLQAQLDSSSVTLVARTGVGQCRQDLGVGFLGESACRAWLSVFISS